MAARSFVLPGLFLAVIGGCSEDNGLIDYTTTGGLSGNGDGTALHVDPDGTATRPRAGGGMETATLDAMTLDDLHQKIGNAQFPTLAPMYACNCADDFTYNVSAQVDGSVYIVAADSRALYPTPLMILISTLRDIEQRPLGWH